MKGIIIKRQNKITKKCPTIPLKVSKTKSNY
jgi:hypothetical protein